MLRNVGCIGPAAFSCGLVGPLRGPFRSTNCEESPPIFKQYKLADNIDYVYLHSLSVSLLRVSRILDDPEVLEDSLLGSTPTV
jgi:hypothetical protein